MKIIFFVIQLTATGCSRNKANSLKKTLPENLQDQANEILKSSYSFQQTYWNRRV